MSVWSWTISLAAGALGLVLAALDVDELRLALLDSAREQDPTASAALLDSSVTALLWGLFAGTGGLVLVSAGLLVLLLRRRSPARWLLAGCGVLTLPAVLVDQALVHGGHDVDRVSFLVQGGFLVVAVITLLLPGSRPRSTRSRG